MDDNVYLGVWTNWSRGPILGPTLTTTKPHGNLLIAFIASFIAFVAARAWRILCLAFHQHLSTENPRSTLHHQRQVVLRNSTTPESGLLSFLRLLWTWRRSPAKKLTLLGLLTIIAFLSVTAFTVAAGFSSTISTAVGDEVLLNSINCGIPWDGPSPQRSIETASMQIRFAGEFLNDASNYAQQCYQQTNLGSMECNRFVVSHLPTVTTNNNASCPFDQKICRTPNSNIRLDSGFIDTRDLGLNAREEESLAVRYMLHCAPLETTGYTSRAIQRGQKVVRYHYGSSYIGPSDNITARNFTHQAQDIDTQYSGTKINQVSGNFRLT